jgi:predicted RNase H-like nuclease (RuvC/YqgF family)
MGVEMNNAEQIQHMLSDAREVYDTLIDDEEKKELAQTIQGLESLHTSAQYIDAQDKTLEALKKKNEELKREYEELKLKRENEDLKRECAGLKKAYLHLKKQMMKGCENEQT